MSKDDKVCNWMEKIPKQFKRTMIDKTYPKHMIKPCSMIVSIGQTNSGKTNSVVDFLNRKNGQFYEIIIFTGSSSDEPLYNFLASHITGLQLIDNVAELPNIDDYKDEERKDLEKMVVFDDSIMSDKKVLNAIAKWFMCARKVGFTCIFLSQSYHSIPTFIRRNAHYLHLFKITDVADMKKILSKHCMDVDLNTLKNMLKFASEEKGQFLNIALNEPKNVRYRKNFIQILDPNEYKNKIID